MWSIAINVSACLSVCLSIGLSICSHISKNYVSKCHKIFCTYYLFSVVWFYSGDIVIRHVLPVLWMTSCVYIMAAPGTKFEVAVLLNFVLFYTVEWQFWGLTMRQKCLLAGLPTLAEPPPSVIDALTTLIHGLVSGWWWTGEWWESVGDAASAGRGHHPVFTGHRSVSHLWRLQRPWRLTVSVRQGQSRTRIWVSRSHRGYWRGKSRSRATVWRSRDDETKDWSESKPDSSRLRRPMSGSQGGPRSRTGVWRSRGG